MARLYPSLIGAPFLALGHVIETLEPLCDGFHVDVMDFRFVPNMTWGPDSVNAIRDAVKKRLWVHLMVEEPEKFLSRLMLHPHDIVSVHYEVLSNTRLTKIIHELHRQGLKASIALNPATPVEVVKHFYHDIDQILLMSVNPGFSGQKFLDTTYERLQTLYDLREEHNLHFSIGIDGGITMQIMHEILKRGADDIALASALFDEHKPLQQLEEFKKLTDRYANGGL